MIVESGINQGKRVVQRSGRWIDTAEISEFLAQKFPHMEFPFLQDDHVAGVASNVHAFCNKHQQFTKMNISSVRSGGTRYACVACAVEQQILDPKKFIRYTRNPMTPVGVESGIFRAIKAEFPDAYLWHKMSNGKEIDIFIPSLNAGVEYNGNYWHSTAIKEDKNYHLLKTAYASKNQIRQINGVESGALVYHVLTDEALATSDYRGIVHQFKLNRDACDIEFRKLRKYKVKPLCVADALNFHKNYNYLYSACLVTYPDNFGIWVGSELVSVFSGHQNTGTIHAHSVKYSWVDYTKIVEILLPRFRGAIRLLAELNNHNTYFVLSNFLFSGRTPITEKIPQKTAFSDGTLDIGKRYLKIHIPRAYPLNEKYEVDLNLALEKATAKIYDCGMVELIVT